MFEVLTPAYADKDMWLLNIWNMYAIVSEPLCQLKVHRGFLYITLPCVPLRYPSLPCHLEKRPCPSHFGRPVRLGRLTGQYTATQMGKTK